MARHVNAVDCAFCHAPITRGTNQAQRRFCDPAHREAAYRRRRLGLPEDYPHVSDLARAARAYQRLRAASSGHHAHA